MILASLSQIIPIYLVKSNVFWIVGIMHDHPHRFPWSKFVFFSPIIAEIPLRNSILRSLIRFLAFNVFFRISQVSPIFFRLKSGGSHVFSLPPGWWRGWRTARPPRVSAASATRCWSPWGIP